jgi:Caspase domain
VGGQRKALIVANDEYEQEGLRHLLAPAADAEALRRVLGDPKIGDFAVQVARNEPAHVIQAQIEELFSDSRSDDVLLLHFSCHGLKSESGELFFAASNTRPKLLGSTAISADFVQRCMRASRSRRIVLLLDCCYGGAFGQGVAVRASGDVNVLGSFPHEGSGGGRGRAVITASSAMEYAFEGDQLAEDHSPRPSVFTSALVKGLATGEADRDEDGWVSLDDLYDYVFDKVREQNPHQTPSRAVEMQGELYLARSQRRRVRAAPIPPDLRAAMTDPNMFSRLGAVGELRSRLASDNLPAAVGAYEALAEIARTDIRSVADPASAALREVAVHPAETELHFGQVAQGSASPHRIVQLSGLPIARACVPHASHDWIHVEQTSEGLDISVDTSRAGMLRGSVEVKGPTGEAVVTLDVDLVPPLPQTPSRPSGERTDDRTQKVTPTPTPQPEDQPTASSPPPRPDSLSTSPDAPTQTGDTTARDTGEATGPIAGHTSAPAVSARQLTKGVKRARIIPVLWALMPVWSFSLLTPVPFAYAAIRLRDWRLWGITAAYGIVWLTLVLTNSAAHPPQGKGSTPAEFVTAGLLFALVALATGHAWWLRRRVFAPPTTNP